MSESAIRTEIYNILSGVASIGKVYDYERWTKDWKAFIDLFKDSTGKILGWEISRGKAGEEKITIGIGNNEDERAHTYIIRGYMAIDDSEATEKTFNALIEAAATAFRAKRTLNESAEDNQGLQCDVIDARTFGGVLCHYAELRLVAIERI